MKIKARSLRVFLLAVFATLCCGVGIAVNEPTVSAKAADDSRAVEMIAGASVRKKYDAGIKFTAKIANYDENKTYGMLILPESAWDTCGWTNDTDYFAYFQTNNITNFAHKECTPYEENGKWYISLSLTNLLEENFDRSFVGVAYEYNGSSYSYAKIDRLDNARSMAYVAQMALKYDANLTDDQETMLKNYMNSDEIGKNVYFESIMGDGESATAGNANYAMKYTLNVSEAISQITKEAYPAGSTVSFKYYIPAGTSTAWWGLAWSETTTGLDIYGAAGANAHHPATKVGEWVTESFTLPAEGGPYYLYFGAEDGHWTHSSGNPYLLIDDVTINGKVETFNLHFESSIFHMLDASAIGTYAYSGKASVLGASPETETDNEVLERENGAIKLPIDAAHADGQLITQKAYKGGSTISFDYLIPDDVYFTGSTSWWHVLYTTDSSKKDIYEHSYALYSPDKSMEQGVWHSVSFTLPEDDNNYYFYFGAAIGEWKIGNDQVGYMLIDNVQINSVTRETDSFNTGVDTGMFNVTTPAGKQPVVQMDYTSGGIAAKYTFGIDGLSMITKTAVAKGGETVSFKYYIAEATTQAGWWGIAWNKDATAASIYNAAGIYNDGTAYSDYKALGKTVGAWTEVSFTLPAGGPYYLYFGSPVNDTEWKLPDGSKSYALIEDFKIGSTVETFDNGVANSIFTSNVAEYPLTEGVGLQQSPGTVRLIIDRMNEQTGKVDFITKKAYAAGSVITFKFYIPEGTTTSWWGIAWHTDVSKANIYQAGGAENPIGYKALASNVKGQWVNESVTLPQEGGPYYLYFGGAVSNWGMKEGKVGYVLIDDFSVATPIGTQAEDYNTTADSNIFNGEESVDLVSENNLAAAIDMVKIGSEDGKMTYSTKSAYKNIGKITFYAKTGTKSSWWGIALATDLSKAELYDVRLTNDAVTSGSWAKISYVFMGGKCNVYVNDSLKKTVEYAMDSKAAYHIYFIGAAGESQKFNADIMIDNFSITCKNGTVVSDDFSCGLEGGLFQIRDKDRTRDIVNLVDATDYVERPAGIHDEDCALENLVSSGAITDYLTSGGYATLLPSESLNISGVSASMIVLEGAFSYTINGEKEFAIYFGNGSYLHVSTTTISLFNGTELVNQMEVSSAETITFVVTAGGRLYLGTNGSYKGFGTMNAPASMSVVALGGKGTVTFGNFEIDKYEKLA